MIDRSLRGPFYGRDLAQIRSIIDSRGVRGVAELTVDAIERTQPQLNAFVHLDHERVLADADRLDSVPEDERGVLHGIPVAVKDLIDVAGWPATSGSRLLADRMAEQDADVVRRLREAGALIVGMTLTHEFAYGPTGDLSKDGPSHNPHDLDRMTGGSSAGSGAAVAAGVVPLALGTDTGGSVRVPAALCGCVGLKPGHGDISLDGVHPLAPTLDHVGVLAEDLDLAWQAWAVLADRPIPGEAEPHWAWLDTDRVPLVDRDVRALVRTVFDEASAHSTAEIALGNWPEMRGVAGTIMSREAYDTHAHQVDSRRAEYETETWERLDSGRHIDDGQYAQALETRTLWRDTLGSFLEPEQVLVSPTVSITAPSIGEREMTVGDESGTSTRIVTNLTVRWNLVGYPAMSVPIGEIGGLPVGMQLICRPGSEPALRAAAAQVTRWVRGQDGSAEA